LLERFDVPAVVFVTTGCLDSDAFWWDELCGLVFASASRADTENRSWRAWDDNLAALPAQYLSTWESLRTLDDRDRRRALDAMRRAAGREWRAASQDPRPLTTDELVALSRCPLVELGCHTRTHPVLSALDCASQRLEIAGSREDLETLTGRTPTAFSYPYGHRCDYSATTVGLVHEAGFHTACAIDSATGDTVDRLRVPRIQVDDCDGDEFSRRLSGWLAGV
jgi:peptidoglycan/xylan/chitin deacetylase (PgdA/CDA1 family)